METTPQLVAFWKLTTSKWWDSEKPKYSLVEPLESSSLCPTPLVKP